MYDNYVWNNHELSKHAYRFLLCYRITKIQLEGVTGIMTRCLISNFSLQW